jgi:hypothetical protein
MTDAPEKMWVYPKLDWFVAGASNFPIVTAGANDVEYTRSDIAEAKAASLEFYIMQMEDNLYKLEAEVARLREALVLITVAYDPKDYGGNSEVMFSIAGAALQSHGETDQ